MADARKHTCAQGDHIARLAKEGGFTHWKTVWDANEALGKSRKNPNMLCPGDEVVVPARQDQEESATTGQYNDYQLDEYDLFLRLRILKGDLTVLANAPYSLEIDAEPVPRTGTTDGNGQLEEVIPPEARKAKLTVRAPAPEGAKGQVQAEVPMTWELNLGALLPIADETPDPLLYMAVQQRLRNLGFYSGPVNGEWNDSTKTAVRGFREIYGPKGSDKPADAFLRKLEEVHDHPKG